MVKITTRAELLENIENVRAVEFLARKGYIEDTENFSNEKLKTTITAIKEDEDRHIGLLDELIGLLK